MTDHKYYFEHQETPQIEQILVDGINAEAAKKKGMKPARSFEISVKDSSGTILGGTTGFIFHGCLFTDLLWVSEKMRGQGIGRELMLEVEKIGHDRHCTFAAVNTMDWEALPFYQKLGYEIEFVREGFDKQSKMYMLRKNL